MKIHFYYRKNEFFTQLAKKKPLSIVLADLFISWRINVCAYFDVWSGKRWVCSHTGPNDTSTIRARNMKSGKSMLDASIPLMNNHLQINNRLLKIIDTINQLNHIQNSLSCMIFSYSK